jgi:predicted DNA-binding protein
MPHGVHKKDQTAFRLPESLLAWLRDYAKRQSRTMTDIVNEALADYRAKHDTEEND